MWECCVGTTERKKVENKQERREKCNLKQTRREWVREKLHCNYISFFIIKFTLGSLPHSSLTISRIFFFPSYKREGEMDGSNVINSRYVWRSLFAFFSSRIRSFAFIVAATSSFISNIVEHCTECFHGYMKFNAFQWQFSPQHFCKSPSSENFLLQTKELNNISKLPLFYPIHESKQTLWSDN
jgi:hypothetical protein